MNGHERQKEQSRQMIEDALFALMEEKEYRQISVSEITERAGVARRTFYRLYQSKEDVIDAYFDRLCMEYQIGCSPIRGYDIGQIAMEYFSFWYQYKDFLLLLHRSGLDSMLFLGINRASEQVIRSRIGEHPMQQIPELIYFITYSTGGFMNLLFDWIKSGMEMRPETYAEVTSDAIKKVLQAQKLV